jgi:uncharacterized membrane protein YgaE (UPF0421/DUF939 family)
MKRQYTIALFALSLLLWTGAGQRAQAQDPVLAVIKEGVTRAIVAMDLKIQRLQNKTIWLQNAQKVLENKLSELRLTEIADWSERQRQLYASYHEELWQVKRVLAYYQRVRELVQKQEALLQAYRRTYRLLQADANFTPGELTYMEQVYSGILEASLKDLDLLLLALESFTTQISDAGRLEVIHQVAGRMDRHYHDLQAFNEQNIRLALQRASARHTLESLQQLYGLPGRP